MNEIVTNELRIKKLRKILTTMIINNYGDDDDEWLKLLSDAVDGVILPAAK